MEIKLLEILFCCTYIICLFIYLFIYSCIIIMKYIFNSNINKNQKNKDIFANLHYNNFHGLK